MAVIKSQDKKGVSLDLAFQIEIGKLLGGLNWTLFAGLMTYALWYPVL